MKGVRFLLISIVLLGIFLRFYQLGITPPGLEWDEVAIGYDAYSILKTGRDQFGKFLPLTFRSLDDFKPPLYVYSAVPGIMLFGLNEFTARLPSALYGVGAVILVYFLIQEVFWDKPPKDRILLGLLSALFLAISPWHLQFSRAAFETNLSVTVTILAVFLFFRGIRLNNTKLFLSSALVFGIALFSYHSARIVTPIVLVSLLILLKNSLPQKKIIAFFLGIYAIFFILFIPIATSKDAQIRFIVTNALNINYYQDQAATTIYEDKQRGAGIVADIFLNRRFAIFNWDNVLTVTKNYFIHFSPEYLFVKGDAPLHHAPDFGIMYFFDSVFLVVGLIFYLLKYRNRQNLILLIWLLASPIPAAVTIQVPHSVRTEIMIPTIQIFSAMGLFVLYKFLRNESKWLTKFFVLIFCGILYFGMGTYLYHYYFYTNWKISDKWLYGRKEAVKYTEALKSHYDKVIVSLSVDMPLNFWLFYSKYSPSIYLAEGGTRSGGYADETNHFDKYEFKNFNYDLIKSSSERILLVGTQKDFPTDIKTLKTINYLDGTPGILIVEAGAMR